MDRLAYAVAVSNTIVDIAFYVCVISVFIAGGTAILLLLEKIQQNKPADIKPRAVKPSKLKISPAKGTAKKRS